jgi:hypothetical protein
MQPLKDADKVFDFPARVAELSFAPFGEILMSQTKAKRKRYELDEARIRRVQKLLGARTETEAIELALDEVITERERNRQAWAATERLLKSRIQVIDVFGRLEERQG